MENYDKNYFIGPHRGEFLPIKIKSIHRQRLPIRRIEAGHTASCSIVFRHDQSGNQGPPTGFKIRRGQVILSFLPEKAFWKFEAEIDTSNQPFMLTIGSQGVIYARNVRQGAKVLSIDSTGVKRRVTFAFVYEPEWLQLDRILLFRQDQTNFIGKIVNLHSNI